jgi:NADH-quinone oxidoreductase subunit J
MNELINNLSFFIPAGVMVLFAFGTIIATNPLYSVLSLMMCFVGLSGLCFVLSVDFIAALIIIVYVGAIIILCLFITMMIEHKIFPLRQQISRMWPVGMLLALCIIYVICAKFFQDIHGISLPLDLPDGYSNVHDIATSMYTKFTFEIQIVGVLLFIGVVAAVVLTIEYLKKSPRTKLPIHQRMRTASESIDIITPENGEPVRY